jgi:hypothetical protein
VILEKFFNFEQFLFSIKRTCSTFLRQDILHIVTCDAVTTFALGSWLELRRSRGEPQKAASILYCFPSTYKTRLFFQRESCASGTQFILCLSRRSRLSQTDCDRISHPLLWVRYPVLHRLKIACFERPCYLGSTNLHFKALGSTLFVMTDAASFDVKTPN